MKREARKASLQRDTSQHILTPEALYEFSMAKLKGIKFFFVTSEEIERAKHELSERFDACHRIPNTRDYHSFIPLDQYTIRAFRVSGGRQFQDTIVYRPIKENLQYRPEISDYIGCVYEEKWYIGMVIAINVEQQDCKIKFMIPAGPAKSFHWEPISPSWLPFKNVLKKIEAPTTETGRQYKIPKEISNELDALLISWIADEEE